MSGWPSSRRASSRPPPPPPTTYSANSSPPPAPRTSPAASSPPSPWSPLSPPSSRNGIETVSEELLDQEQKFVIVDASGRDEALEYGSKIACVVSRVLFHD